MKRSSKAKRGEHIAAMMMTSMTKQAMTTNGEGISAQLRLTSNNNATDIITTRILPISTEAHFFPRMFADRRSPEDLLVGARVDEFRRSRYIYSMSFHYITPNPMTQRFSRWFCCPDAGVKEEQIVTCREDHPAFPQSVR
jgi:hypothetical protein